ncbi:MAG: hypothetical protein KatS3mg077_2892 [Candidatus Binatia bacterium]|nr:MAG: hypothetical protein KatS3mg077_2892 [Candidatus Binatia bacterium]
METVTNVLAVAGLASGGYGAVEAGRNGMYASAAVGALLLAAGAYALRRQLQGGEEASGGSSGEGSQGGGIQYAQADTGTMSDAGGRAAVRARQEGGAVVIEYDDGTLEVRSGGTVSWRTNNPGNLQAGPFARGHGSIGEFANDDRHRIAVFPNEAAGQAALEARLTTPPCTRYTLDLAIENWAPPPHNPTDRYQAFVTRQLGVSGSTRLNSLTPSQIRTLADAIRKFEGSRPGRVVVLPGRT